MTKISESLTVADFFEKLQHDELDTSVPFSIFGMVKKSKGKDKTIELAPGGNCSNWVTIPLDFIEDVDVMKTIKCKDHSHPLVKLNMKTPTTPEGKIFFALLESMKQGVEEMKYGYATPQSGHPTSGIESATKSTARLAGGGIGMDIGGLGTKDDTVCKYVFKCRYYPWGPQCYYDYCCFSDTTGTWGCI